MTNAYLLPHQQIRRRPPTKANKTIESPHGSVILDEEIAAAGCYHSEISYDRPVADRWEF
jgi:hypothetical protein